MPKGFLRKAWDSLKSYGRAAWGYIKGMNGKKAGAALGSALGGYAGAAIGAPEVGALAGSYLGSGLGGFAQNYVDEALSGAYGRAANEMIEKGLDTVESYVERNIPGLREAKLRQKARAKEQMLKPRRLLGENEGAWKSFTQKESEKNPLPVIKDDSEVPYNTIRNKFS